MLPVGLAGNAEGRDAVAPTRPTVGLALDDQDPAALANLSEPVQPVEHHPIAAPPTEPLPVRVEAVSVADAGFLAVHVQVRHDHGRRAVQLLVAQAQRPQEVDRELLGLGELGEGDPPRADHTAFTGITAR